MRSKNKAIILLFMGFVLHFMPGCYYLSLFAMTFGAIEVIFDD